MFAGFHLYKLIEVFWHSTLDTVSKRATVAVGGFTFTGVWKNVPPPSYSFLSGDKCNTMYICMAICRALLGAALCCGKKRWQLCQQRWPVELQAVASVTCPVTSRLCWSERHYPRYCCGTGLTSMSAPEQQFSSEANGGFWGMRLLNAAEGIWSRCRCAGLCFNRHLKWVWRDSITNQLALPQPRNYSVCSFWKAASTSIDR